MIKLWVEQNYAPPEKYPLELEEFEIGGHKCIGYENEDIKWYEDYDDISAVEALKDKFKEAFSPDNASAVSGCYEFIRIGEDLEDIVREDFNNDDCLISVNRYICDY